MQSRKVPAGLLSLQVPTFFSRDLQRSALEFVKVEEPDVSKPIMIAAMQDMGNVGSIAIDFINKTLQTKCFRYVSPPYPNYVEDKSGHIDFQQEKWEYRYGNGVIVFGGGI